MQERLQKIIARAGLASRRRAETLITSGQVAVNGRIITELGAKADAARDHIRVSGKVIRTRAPEAETKVYIALHKPDAVVSTLRDPEGRKTIADFLRGLPGRVYPVGRLEYHASGLLLLTNDGELANRLMRAHNLRQIYLCKIDPAPAAEEIRELERRASVKVSRAKSMPAGWWEVKTIAAGKDAFRKSLLASRHHVDKLRRVAIANIELGPLPSGRYRHIPREEIVSLDRLLSKSERHNEK